MDNINLVPGIDLSYHRSYLVFSTGYEVYIRIIYSTRYSI